MSKFKIFNINFIKINLKSRVIILLYLILKYFMLTVVIKDKKRILLTNQILATYYFYWSIDWNNKILSYKMYLNFLLNIFKKLRIDDKINLTF